MMRQLVIAGILGSALLGCNSEQDVAKQRPDEILSSNKIQSEIVNCLSDKAATDGRTVFNNDGSVSVLIAGELNVIASFTVHAEGSRSRVEVRKTNWPILINFRACL